LTGSHPYPTNIPIKSTRTRVFSHRDPVYLDFDTGQDFSILSTAGYIPILGIIGVVFLRVPILLSWVLTRIAAAAWGRGGRAVPILTDPNIAVLINFYVIFSITARRGVVSVRGADRGKIGWVAGRGILVVRITTVIGPLTPDAYFYSISRH
jgi:hypothetical protein